MTTHHALLIGVDHYFEYPLPEGLVYRKLGGCVRDINKVYNFLTKRMEIDPKNIIKLTATNGGQRPVEPENEWPTYRNMVNAFQELAGRVQKGDEVYIQYSGHGGRARTMLPELKGENGHDEGLVPLDIGKPGDTDAQYLRDFQMYNLLQAFVDKKVHLTVVFDCCHSGGATRDAGGARKRGPGKPDQSPPPTALPIGDLATMVARWQGEGGGTARAANNQSSWLFEPQGYTLFAACRANESAFEFPFEKGESNGALTYWMLDTLAQANENTTWKMVADRVAAKVHGQFEQQIPSLQGEGDLTVFGAKKLSSKYTVPVLKIDKGSRRAQLNAGEAHGLTVGTQFAIFPSAAEVEDETKQLAVVELTDVDAVNAWAEVVEPEKGFPIEDGMQAVLLTGSTVRVQRTVRVANPDESLQKDIEAEINAHGNGFIAPATPGEGADFLVDVTAESPATFVIQDSGGNTLPYINPPLVVGEEGNLTKLVERLVHLAQFRNVQMLDMPDPDAASKLEVAIDGKRVNKPGDKFRIHITNTQEPNPHNPDDPSRMLNVTVLTLSSDWSISQFYPQGAGWFQEVRPGETIWLDVDPYLPEGQTESLDIFKIFATRSATNFRWLELPTLDESIKRSAARSPSGDPLEQLLAMATGEQTELRAVRLNASSHQEKGWTVSQVEVIVTEDGQEPQLLSTPTAGEIAEREAAATASTSQPTPTKAQVDAAALGLTNSDEFQIFVEFTEAELLERGVEPGAVGRGFGDATAQLQERSQNAIKAAMETIREMAMQTDLMRKGIPGGSQPRMVKIKFGINMDVQFGAFLAKAGANATMEVELEWARRSDDVLRVLRAETDVDSALFTDADERKAGDA